MRQSSLWAFVFTGFKRRALQLGVVLGTLAGAVGVQAQTPVAKPDLATLTQQVREAELAFAQTMAQRDHAAFTRFVAEDAIFFGRAVSRGREAVAQAWRPLFEGAQAPFSWAPDQVEVLAGGQLAHSSGPVRGADGALMGRFNSVWRQESPGVWRVVFDRGEAPPAPPCDCAKRP